MFVARGVGFAASAQSSGNKQLCVMRIRFSDETELSLHPDSLYNGVSRQRTNFYSQPLPLPPNLLTLTMEQANGTRQRGSGSRPDGTSTQSPKTTEKNLPPARRGKAIRKDIPLPFEHTSLSKFIYGLVFLTTLLSAFYGYRMVKHKNEVGGWWNLALGRRPPIVQDAYATAGKAGDSSSKQYGVEEKINELAEALGMPSNELASAIALAVRNYVPPASLSSVAAKETGTAVKVLIEGAAESESLAVPTSSPTATGVVGGVVEGLEKGFESFVGFEEP